MCQKKKSKLGKNKMKIVHLFLHCDLQHELLQNYIVQIVWKKKKSLVNSMLVLPHVKKR